MTAFGYALSSEEHRPADLISNARRAEETGFSFALISDHYHPWIDRQGQSPFVWSILGGLAQATDRLQIGTGVTCPTVRIHPAVIAQAAATTAALMPGRFFLGVGTGENLNEHILGDGWPEWEVRAEMLEEAVEIIRELWRGEMTSHRGDYYTVENARLYTLPDEPPPIHVAASGTKMAEIAGRIGDGFIGTDPDREVMDAFEASGGSGPRYGQVTLCWATTEADARRTALEVWPNSAIRGEASQELPLPAHFGQLAAMVDEDAIGESVLCGPDPGPVLEKVRAYVEAGYDHVYFHQVGPDQAGFFDFAARELLPALSSEPVGSRPPGG
ncbi:MAG: TIGR03557 family F420-dependent LLM class oxidoreductase [Candidatus Limnocylindrales bacterium]